MPRKKSFIVMAAICWIAVLAFGPRTMTNSHVATDSTKSNKSVDIKTAKDKPKIKPVETKANSPDIVQPSVNSETPSDSSAPAVTNINTQTPSPVIDEIPVAKPVISIPLPTPIIPKLPPVCGGCGRTNQDNKLTIRCPMYEIPSSYVCAL